MGILGVIYEFLESCTELLQYFAQLLMKSMENKFLSEPLANAAKTLSSMIFSATLYDLELESDYRRMRFWETNVRMLRVPHETTKSNPGDKLLSISD